MSQSQRQHPRKWSQARDHLFSPGNQPNLREELPRNSDGVGVAAAEVHRALPPPPAPAPALSKKGTPWTEEEHLLFLEGLHKFGKGDWKSIARYCVVSRSPSQIASHAQKYFLRHNPISEKRRKRKSIHDITLREPIHVREPIHNIPIGQPIHDIPIAIGEPIHGIPIGHDIPIGEPIHSIPIMEPIHDINLGEGLVPPFLDHHYLFPNLQNWELYTPNWLLPQDIAMQQQLQELQQAQELFNSNPPNYLPLQGYGFGKFNNCL